MFRSPKIDIPVWGLIENMAWFTPEDAPEKKYYIFGKGGGAALAVAALAARGQSRLCKIHHIARGYENFDLNLKKLGAQITRV